MRSPRPASGRIRFACAALVAVLAAGCASAGEPGSGGTTQPGGATVVQGSDMSGMLLDGLRTRVRSMNVAPGPSGPCPRIIFRGRRSMGQQGDPTIYVDGTLVGDTCVLAQMSASEVDYVEVYPGGIVGRPGVQRNPFGTIIVHRIR